MQGAVRVVGRKASRPIHLRAQLLEKLSAWPGRKPQAREELKGVGADVWPAWLKAQLPDLCAGGASNHLAENRVGKANCATSSCFKSKQHFSHCFLVQMAVEML